MARYLDIHKRKIRCTEKFANFMHLYYKRQHPKTNSRVFIPDENWECQPCQDHQIPTDVKIYAAHFGEFLFGFTDEQYEVVKDWYIGYKLNFITEKPILINEFEFMN